MNFKIALVLLAAVIHCSHGSCNLATFADCGAEFISSNFRNALLGTWDEDLLCRDWEKLGVCVSSSPHDCDEDQIIIWETLKRVGRFFCEDPEGFKATRCAMKKARSMDCTVDVRANIDTLLADPCAYEEMLLKCYLDGTETFCGRQDAEWLAKFFDATLTYVNNNIGCNVSAVGLLNSNPEPTLTFRGTEL